MCNILNRADLLAQLKPHLFHVLTYNEVCVATCMQAIYTLITEVGQGEGAPADWQQSSGDHMTSDGRDEPYC